MPSKSSDRKFLVYCPTNGKDMKADLLGKGRTFDVALNNYKGGAEGLEGAEHQFQLVGHKWPGVYQNIGPLLDRYQAFAFLDDDIEATTDQLNQLFRIGIAENFRLWQAALTSDSYWSHYRFVHIPGNSIRSTPFVEIMMPFFSRQALRLCFSTFKETQSGWGLDMVWPPLLGGQGIAIVDSVALRHSRPIQSDKWIMPNGLTPHQEASILKTKYQFVFGNSDPSAFALKYGRKE